MLGGVTTNVIHRVLQGEEARARKPKRGRGPSPATDIILCDASVCHFATAGRDSGWGCGFRNLQMMWSYIAANDPYCSVAAASSLGSAEVPDIPRLQLLIDEAWANGFDAAGVSVGSDHSTLVGSRRWIGAVEVACALRYIGIRARIVDIDSGERSGKVLLDFAWRYFHSPSTILEHQYPSSPSTSAGTTSSSPASPSSSAASPSGGVRGQVKQISPLYLQHQGHARTIIGAERLQDGEIVLLLLDPSSSHFGVEKNLVFGSTNSFVIREAKLKHRQYQVVFLDGVYMSEREINESKRITSMLAS